jgi:RNA polymerase subunit RPABC4/transcription elongation factor Spt4
MSVGKFCKKCSRFTAAKNWCDRHGKYVTGWTDMCDEEKAERAERIKNAG